MPHLNGTSVWPGHAASPPKPDDHRGVTDAFVYVIIVMMFYAAGIILLMTRYARSTSERAASGDYENYYSSVGNRETMGLLAAPLDGDDLAAEDERNQREGNVIRFFRTFLSKKSVHGTSHSLDLDGDTSDTGSMV